MTESPLATVIISSYRQMKYVYQAIDSVLRQDYPKIELIVTDDGSPEFIIDDVKSYIDRNRRGNIAHALVMKNETNVGTVKNYNGALKVARGKYIMMLDGDDLYAPYSVSRAVDFMENNPDYYVAGGALHRL